VPLIDDDGFVVMVPIVGSPGLLHLPHEQPWQRSARVRLNKERSRPYAASLDVDWQPDPGDDTPRIDWEDLPPWPAPSQLPGPLTDGSGSPPAWWDADEAATRVRKQFTTPPEGKEN
jgi:hypothetical protein